MNEKKARPSIKRVLKIIGAVLLVGFIVQCLFDPLSDVLRFGNRLKARATLPQARSKWEAQGITHYKFDVFVGSGACFASANIEVENGVTIRAEPRSDAGPEGDSFYSPIFWGYENGPFICNYKNYTMSLLFDHVDDLLTSEPSYVSRISFDAKYGFVSDLYSEYCGSRHGLLSPKASECFAGFTIENFRVLGE